MDPPFGHNTRRDHHQRNDEEDERERPPFPPYHQETQFPPAAAPPPPYYPGNEFAPPSYYPGNEFAPPPPETKEPGFLNYPSHPTPPATQVTHVHHSSGGYEQEPGFLNYDQPPPPTQVTHVSHQANQQPYEQGTDQIHNSSFSPHLPSFVPHHTDKGSSDGLSSKPTVKVFCKAGPNFSLTFREGKVILAPSDPSDQFQHWYKDEKYSTRVKDEEGFPCFALVNKATGQAIRGSVGDTNSVQLVPYNPDVLDLSILWTQSKDFGDGFRTIRMVNDIKLNVDAIHGDKKSGGIHDGISIGLWKWNQGDNQLWKIAPY